MNEIIRFREKHEAERAIWEQGAGGRSDDNFDELISEINKLKSKVRSLKDQKIDLKNKMKHDKEAVEHEIKVRIHKYRL